jgi:hypothetical protein
MAQCVFCLTWQYLSSGFDIPKKEDKFLCKNVNSVCSNATRLPNCVSAIALRFLRRQDGPINALLKNEETKCQQYFPPVLSTIPKVVSFVSVGSSSHALFNYVRQVIQVFADRTKITVNFSSVLTVIQISFHIIIAYNNIVLAPAQALPDHSEKPVVLKKQIQSLISSKVPLWLLPDSLLLSDSALALLLEWRPVTATGVRGICGTEIAECYISAVVEMITKHQIENQVKNIEKKKKRYKKNTGDDNEGSKDKEAVTGFLEKTKNNKR